MLEQRSIGTHMERTYESFMGSSVYLLMACTRSEHGNPCAFDTQVTSDKMISSALHCQAHMVTCVILFYLQVMPTIDKSSEAVFPSTGGAEQSRWDVSAASLARVCIPASKLGVGMQASPSVRYTSLLAYLRIADGQDGQEGDWKISKDERLWRRLEG